MGSLKHGLYLVAALGMIVYALPRLEMGQEWTSATVFGVMWIAMMLLVVAAQLHELLGVNESKRKELERVRLYKRRQVQRWVETKVRAYSRGK